MTKKIRNNIIALTVSIFLFCALINGLPYGFFTFLRFIVCGGAVYIAIVSFESKKMILFLFFSFIALLFNPFIPIYLRRDIWKIIDIITALAFLCSTFILHVSEKNIKENAESKK